MRERKKGGGGGWMRKVRGRRKGWRRAVSVDGRGTCPLALANS